MIAIWLVLAALICLLPAVRTARPRSRRAGAGRAGAGRAGAGRRRAARAARTRPGASPARAAVLVRPGTVALAALACLAVGGPVPGVITAVVVCPLLWLAIARAQGRPPPLPDDPQLPIALDLAAAALRGGRPLADALGRAAPAAGAASQAGLDRVAGLLRLGSEAAQAWQPVADGPLAPVAVVAVRSAASGIRVAAAFEDLAEQLRDERRAAGAVRAHRAGVRAMGPLAACFLPSFVCLGIVPVVVGIARQALQVVP